MINYREPRKTVFDGPRNLTNRPPSLASTRNMHKLLIVFFGLFLIIVTNGSAACTGSPNCTVCTTCSRCAYCKAGGTCGAKHRGAVVPTATPTGTPAPAAVATPRFTIPKLNRIVVSTYPKTVQLTTPVDFEITADGKPSGSLNAPKGAIVKLLSVQPKETVVVEYLGNQKLIPRSSTDLDSHTAPTQRQ